MKVDVRDRFDPSGEPARLPTTIGEQDPILEVAGVSAFDILLRCDEIRRGGRPAGRRQLRRVTAANSRRLLDFADLSDEDFVREAHRLLLGRGASSAEFGAPSGRIGERLIAD